MKIDFVSDVICPWCFIGLARLEQALSERASDAEIVFHPFQLDPSTPPEGADLRERLRAKYGVDPERMFARVTAAAKESGIAIDFRKVRRTPNTLKAHALIGAAEDARSQHRLARALFEAYFQEGLDVGDEDVLTDAAEKAGMARGRAAAVLADPAALERAQNEARALSAQGIGGVPFVVFDGKVAVSGAQPPEVFTRAMSRAAEA